MEPRQEEECLKPDLQQMIRMEVARQKREGSVSHSTAASEYIKHCLRHKKAYLLLALILIALGATAVGLEAKILEKDDGDARGTTKETKKYYMRTALETIIDLLDTTDSNKLFRILKSAKSRKERKKKMIDLNATEENVESVPDE